MTFTLPWPPSVNRMWRHDPRTGRTLLSKEGRLYRDHAGWLLLGQKAEQYHKTPHGFPMQGRLSVTLTYHRGDERSFDVDNFCKAVGDILHHCGIIVDDSQIDRLVQIRGAVRPRAGCVVVEVEELV